MNIKEIEQQFPLYPASTVRGKYLRAGLGTADPKQHEMLALLGMPFLPHEYEFLKWNELWYLKEPAIIQRLESVFGLEYEITHGEPYIKDIPAHVKLFKDDKGSPLVPLSEIGTSIINWEGKWYQTGTSNTEQSNYRQMIVDKVINPEKTKANKKPTFDEIPRLDSEGNMMYEDVQKETTSSTRNQITVFEGGPVMYVKCTISYVYNGVWFRKENVGSAPIGNLGKSHVERMENAIKAAYTDSLKRVAVRLGVGRELRHMTDMGRDIDSITASLRTEYPDDVRYWSVTQAKAQLIDDLKLIYPPIELPEEERIISTGEQLAEVIEIHALDMNFANEQFYEIRRLLALHKATD